MTSRFLLLDSPIFYMTVPFLRDSLIFHDSPIFLHESPVFLHDSPFFYMSTIFT